MLFVAERPLDMQIIAPVFAHDAPITTKVEAIAARVICSVVKKECHVHKPWINQNQTYETAGRKRSARNEAIWAMHRAGHDAPGIADHFGCSRVHVRDVIRRFRKSARSKVMA
ncbi:MAG: hypothetical protein EP341_09685 [Sphingomonadales bacterium]|nr:MAG: hypothetical protein EP341_09685 [Sphingomonadales bacterium]